MRQTLFGPVEVPPADPIELPDRMGFAYQAKEDLAVGLVPYDQGVSRTWVLAAEGSGDDLRTAITGSSYSGDHKVSPTQLASYYLLRRTTSPVVLGPLIGLGVLVVGLGYLLVGRGSRNRYADFDE